MLSSQSVLLPPSVIQPPTQSGSHPQPERWSSFPESSVTTIATTSTQNVIASSHRPSEEAMLNHTVLRWERTRRSAKTKMRKEREQVQVKTVMHGQRKQRELLFPCAVPTRMRTRTEEARGANAPELLGSKTVEPDPKSEIFYTAVFMPSCRKKKSPRTPSIAVMP
jgi:hypothetical protein